MGSLKSFAPCRVTGSLLLLGGSLVACAPSSPRKGVGTLGYGTPGVSAYAESGDTLRAQLDTCRGVSPPASPGQTQGLPAACEQLNRTVRNQPGNSVRPARAP